MNARIAATMGVFMALTFGLGCSSSNPLNPCDRSIEANPPVAYRDGSIVDGWYQTSDWHGAWLPFKGGQHYRLEHGLGCAPLVVIPYLSFNDDGLAGDDGTSASDAGLASPAAGDAIAVTAVDDKDVIVANATCVDFWLRVVAGGCTQPSDAGAD